MNEKEVQLMQIELVEFYPVEVSKKKVQGTLRIRLPNYGIEILGVQYLQQRDKLFIRLPGRKSHDHITGKEIWYPLISFVEKKTMADLINELKRLAPSFVQDRLKDIRSSDQPPMNIKPRIKIERAKTSFKTAQTPISVNGWQDPPKKY